MDLLRRGEGVGRPKSVLETRNSIYAHQMRHAFASLLLQDGAPIIYCPLK
jgi:integrase